MASGSGFAGPADRSLCVEQEAAQHQGALPECGQTGRFEVEKKKLKIKEVQDLYADKEVKVAKEILKDCNLYKKSPKLVSCPTCGRTQIDLIPIAKEIENFLQGLESDITVAVMGCVVNGPGEARNADIGIAGGIKEGVLFKKGEVIKKIPQEEIVQVLEEEILNMIN